MKSSLENWLSERHRKTQVGKITTMNVKEGTLLTTIVQDPLKLSWDTTIYPTNAAMYFSQ